ncbi:MAG: PAS domain S-box protein [Sandaracinaceae bacterium]
MKTVLAKMRGIIGDAPSALAIFDRDIRYLATSRMWLEQFGGGRASLEGLAHYEVVPDIPEAWREVHRRALKGESLHADEDLFVRADGRRMWLKWSVYPWRDEAGAVRGIVMASEDITLRKEAEAAVRQSEDRYRRLVEASPDAIFIHQDRRITYVNPACLALFGAVAPDELVGLSVLDVIDPAYHEVARARMAEAETGSGPSRAYTRTRRLSGEPRDVEVTALGVELGGRPAIQVVMRDVTAERASAKAAAETAARLAAIVGSAMDAILCVDEDLRIVLANPATEALFGYAQAELLGRDLEVLLPERFRRGHEDRIRAYGRTGESRRSMGAGMVFGRHADGSELPLEATISSAEVDGRRIYTVIHRDLRPRLKAEQELRAGEERFRQLAEAVREVFWLTDVDKNAVHYVSPAFEAVYGRPVSEVYARPRAWLEAIHEVDRPGVLDAALRQADGTYDVEYRVVRPDGSIRWVHDRAFPVRDAEGCIVRIAGVAEDITERRQLEQQLRQTQKLESVGRLAGGVAHDFNNLLTVIVSSAELLSDSGDLSEDAGELVADMLDAGKRGAALTRQLLAFSRQEVIEPRVMDLGAVVIDAEKLLRRLIGEDVEVRTRIDSSSVPVSIDPGQWTQVLFNLAVNARDAMPRGGTLTLETDVMTVGAERDQRDLAPGRYARLRVTDSGTGMTPEVRAKVFEPFFTTKPSGKGTGLGLAVVYGVVRQAGGHVELVSEPGSGTSFTFLLPESDTVTGVSTSEPSTPRQRRARGGETILVVEDEATVRRMLVRLLTAAGYRVIAGANADEATREVDRLAEPVDLLVTDVILPGADGPTLAATMQQRMPAIRVLYTSGYLGESMGNRGISSENLLQKPYSPAVLRDRVRRVLDER